MTPSIITVGCVTREVREGETGDPSRSQPGLRGTRREGGLGRNTPVRFPIPHTGPLYVGCVTRNAPERRSIPHTNPLGNGPVRFSITGTDRVGNELPTLQERK